MKKIIFFLLVLGMFSEANAGNFIYPFSEVAVPSCRFTKWSSLGTNCKMALPKITGADYTKFKDDKTLRKVYSILWGSTYNYGWDVGIGSHLGIDIATSEGTPVRSIGDGEVIVASWLSGWGNTVVIKHKLPDGKYIYSNYSHMSKITASKGNIKSGDLIGEVGSTGNSYGNHLHFQIDITSQSHPYWYSTCSKGVDIMDVVNNGQCRDYLLNNTIDPILFLEGNGNFTSVDSIQTKQAQTVRIEQKNIKSREDILAEEIAEFLKTHTFDLQTQAVGDNLEAGKTYITKLFVYEGSKPFTGNLPGKGIEFNFDNKAMKIFPENAIIIENGSRDIEITGLKNASQYITLKLGNNILMTKQINFFKIGDFASPNDAVLQIDGKNIAIGEERIGGVMMKTKYGSDQINIPYKGTYKLRATTGKVKFCNISFNKSKKCNALELAYELTYKYEDTNAGILVFNMVPLDYSPIKLVVQRVGDKNDITWTKGSYTVYNPNRMDVNYLYFQENIEAIKKSLIRLKGGYLLQDRDFVGSDAKELINNLLSYEFLKSGENYERKNKVIAQLKKFYKNASAIDDFKRITRGEFAKILFDNIGFITDNAGKEFLYDEKGQYKDYIISLRTKYSFRWKDQFADHYFQPDKNLTIGEGIYMIYEMSKNVKF